MSRRQQPRRHRRSHPANANPTDLHARILLLSCSSSHWRSGGRETRPPRLMHQVDSLKADDFTSMRSVTRTGAT